MIDVWYIFYSLIKLRISFLDPQSMQSHRSCCLLMTKPKKHSWEEVVVPYRKYPTSEIQLWFSQYSTQRKENVWYTIIPCLLINVIKWDKKWTTCSPWKWLSVWPPKIWSACNKEILYYWPLQQCDQLEGKQEWSEWPPSASPSAPICPPGATLPSTPPYNPTGP